MELFVPGKEDQDQFKITGLYGVPFSDEHHGEHGANSRFRQIVEQLDAITYVFEIGHSDGLRYVSPQVAELGGTPSSWLVDTAHYANLIYPEDRAKALARIKHSLASGKPLCHEYRLLTANGSYAWYRHQMRLSDDIPQASFLMQGSLVNISKHKEAELALAQAQQQLLALSTMQDEVKGRERHRIAQDVHDELGGLLTCINAYIDLFLQQASLRGEPPDALLCDARRLAAVAIHSVQEIATAMRPNALDTLGLWPAIAAALDQLAAHSGMVTSCDIDPALVSLALDSHLELALYRIVQEALTNVARHAKASRVSMRAQHTAGGLHLAIIDNGVGIAIEAECGRPRWGLIGMRERAARLNGRLVLRPGATGGTELILDMPLEADGGESTNQGTAGRSGTV